MFSFFKRGKTAPFRSAFADLIVCSLLFCLGAASGAYSGSFSPPAVGAASFLAGDRPFLIRFLILALPGAASAVFASSLSGVVILPLLALCMGFFAGFAASVCVSSGGALSLCLSGNWQLLFLLPFFVALISRSLRFSRALVAFFFRGARPDPALAVDFIKYLIIFFIAALAALISQTLFA